MFKAALDAGLWPLAVLAALCTVVGAGYYLWIIKTVWFDAPAQRLDRPAPVMVITAAAATVLTFPVLVVLLGWIEYWANTLSRASF